MNNEVTVVYECDGKACAKCNPKCTHTKDITHAINFSQANHNPNMYAEIPYWSINDYQEDALRTANNRDLPAYLLSEGLMGLNGEAGECIDILKKHVYQGHALDKEALAEELGDVAWYLAVSAHAIGYDLETILKMNVKKLQGRYPNGFEIERSVNR